MLGAPDRDTEGDLKMLLTTRDLLRKENPKLFARISMAVARHFWINCNPVEKFRFTQDAANAGDAYAMHTLSNAYFEGFGTDENFLDGLR